MNQFNISLKRPMFVLASVATLAMVSATTSANTGNPYVGIKAGQFMIDLDDKEFDLDNPVAYGAYVGYNFKNNFGVEAEYLTSSKADIKKPTGATAEYTVESMGVYSTYKYHLPNTFDNAYIKAKLGVAQTEVSVVDAKSSEDFEVAGGFGIGYDIGDMASVEGEFVKLAPAVKDGDSYLWTLSGHYNF